MIRDMRGDRASVRRPKYPAARRAGNPDLAGLQYPLQQEGADLIDDARPLTDQALADAVQGLQVKLSADLVATNFMVGRWIASAIASASRKSFFCPLLYGRTYLAGISRALWPKSCSLRLR
jgi:hypothetical protein